MEEEAKHRFRKVNETWRDIIKLKGGEMVIVKRKPNHPIETEVYGYASHYYKKLSTPLKVENVGGAIDCACFLTPADIIQFIHAEKVR